MVAEYCEYRELMTLQFCGKKFYNQIVPQVMYTRNTMVKIGLFYHLFHNYQYDIDII